MRICIAVPPTGLGRQLDQMHTWLDDNCGASRWMQAPAGTRGVVNDAVAIYFLDPTLAAAFVSRWCIGHRNESEGGAFQMRSDAPTPPKPAPHHKTPP